MLLPTNVIKWKIFNIKNDSNKTTGAQKLRKQIGKLVPYKVYIEINRITKLRLRSSTRTKSYSNRGNDTRVSKRHESTIQQFYRVSSILLDEIGMIGGTNQ